MVAACRAFETARADGLIRDALAQRLAGARGEAILKAIPGWHLMCFGLGLRTRFMDEMVSDDRAGTL